MKPLPFVEELLAELQNADTLVVLARGLGMSAAIARFVVSRVQNNRLLVALGVSRDAAINVLWPAVRAVSRTYPPQDPSLLLPRFINADYSAKDRANVYRTGGFIVVSSTVLVHDLLLRNIPSELVDGIVVFAADRIKPNSNIHFALTVFREQNKKAFVKAFSENAPALACGFHNAEKTMRSLFVSRLSLWPRFHDSVKNSLSRRAPDLVDLRVPLSPSQAALLASLRDVAGKVLDDLRLATRALDLSDVFKPIRDGANARPRLVSNFDDVVRRQLVEAPGNDRFIGGEKVRGLLADLTVVRGLMNDAIDLNSVLFYQKLLTFRHTQTKASFWLMRREAQRMMSIARSRLWIKRKVSAGSTRTEVPRTLKRPRVEDTEDRSDVIVVPVLDVSPKWKVLEAVLQEIERDVLEIGSDADMGRVLVVVRDQSALDELRHVLRIGARAYLQGLLVKTLPSFSKDITWDDDICDEASRVSDSLSPSASCDSAENANANEIVHNTNASSGIMSSASRSFARPALRQATLTQLNTESTPNEALETDRVQNVCMQHKPKPAPTKETASKKNPRASSFRDKKKKKKKRESVFNDEDLNCVRWPWPVRPRVSGKGNENSLHDENGLNGLREYFGIASEDNPAGDIQVLLWCLEWSDALGRGARLLEEYRPNFVVMYNADVTLMRQAEVFRASTSGHPLRMYLLAYDDVVDEDRYRNVVERERSSFRTLIRERATMIVHANQEGKLDEADLSNAYDVGGAAQSSGKHLGEDRDSRQLQISSTVGSSARPRVVVDTRELRSSLPMTLYAHGMTIVPVTLEVGDFVLSKTIAIERKSFSDLVGSFASGRLFNQIDALSRHYRHPCLLIEFDQQARLSLASSAGGVPSELVPSSVTSKVVLLVQQFPGLRLLWAQGAQDSCQLFAALKEKDDDPDENEASSAGVDSANTVDSLFSPGPASLLRSLPGVDGNNMTAVMRKVRNVNALLNMSLGEMTAVLGSAGKAQRLYEFANERPSEALASL